MKSIYSENAPEPIGPYSQGIVSGNFFFSSGQTGLNPETLILKEGGILGQTTQACENIKAVLLSANLGLNDVVKVNIFLSDIRDYEAVNSVYKEYFSHKPARSSLAVAALPSNALVEIEVIAEIK